MKLSATLILASMAVGTQAFVQPSSSFSTTSALRMSEEPGAPAEEEIAAAVVEETPAASSFATEPLLPTMSKAIPYLQRPAALDGSLAGDVGFDPIGFSKTKADLMNYREAEIKHARLAMLAAAGWPLSELFDAKIASTLGLSPVVDATDRAPSILNGGLGKISPIYWLVCIIGAGAIDLAGIAAKNKSKGDWLPGDYGFDPLGLYPKDAAGQERMQLTEIKNGRLAMIAITAFAVQEAVSHVGVVDETPFFFQPPF
ncbi:unnamed protein product [Cylindrotheca closterium]|uniref:Uncharacterized protein n=1 Tax=Cylindrotheca closterium TaxID=2856 RepID=A0AAD2CGR6_9STRA|nr:unnamed protein product [Cylindrotheca closterium]